MPFGTCYPREKEARLARDLQAKPTTVDGLRSRVSARAEIAWGQGADDDSVARGLRGQLIPRGTRSNATIRIIRLLREETDKDRARAERAGIPRDVVDATIEGVAKRHEISRVVRRMIGEIAPDGPSALDADGVIGVLRGNPLRRRGPRAEAKIREMRAGIARVIELGGPVLGEEKTRELLRDRADWLVRRWTRRN